MKLKILCVYLLFLNIASNAQSINLHYGAKDITLTIRNGSNDLYLLRSNYMLRSSIGIYDTANNGFICIDMIKYTNAYILKLQKHTSSDGAKWFIAVYYYPSTDLLIANTYKVISERNNKFKLILYHTEMGDTKSCPSGTYYNSNRSEEVTSNIPNDSSLGMMLDCRSEEEYVRYLGRHASDKSFNFDTYINENNNRQ